MTCNDIHGVVYLDQQVVACYCPTCEQRVAGGHGRPLFSFTRFERHSGSKAKKWRLSIRIDPGAVKEAPAGKWAHAPLSAISCTCVLPGCPSTWAALPQVAAHSPLPAWQVLSWTLCGTVQLLLSLRYALGINLPVALALLLFRR